MKNSIKFIRIAVFSILSLMFMGYVIIEYVDDVKIRLIPFIICCFIEVILIVILLKEPKCAVPRIMILDVLSMAIFIVLMVNLGKGMSETIKLQKAFNGNNGYLCAYSSGIGSKGYDDLGSILEHEIEFEKKSTNQNELEEIYRIQVGDKFFVYFKRTEGVIEFEFFGQNGLFYSSGSKVLKYDGVGSYEGYTVEETIRKDIANTMWRGVDYDEIEAPAWGVSDDEQIFSMSVNSEKVDEVIQIDEIDGKKYYFWIMTNVGEIETIDDVKKAKIEMN
ncbi:MAG: hypothetical protein K2K21_16480 [Lachnospiraceae bacterium]|nr:hypothetical protein [Lachnospiraceae bacterium]